MTGAALAEGDKPPCDGRDPWRKRRLDPWAVGFRQKRAGAGAYGARERRRRVLRADRGRPHFCPQGARSSRSLGERPIWPGVIERRMAGLIAVRHEPAAVVRLAVELCERGRRWPRMPDDDDGLIVGEVTLPRLALDSGLSVCDQALAVEERLAVLAAESSARLGISLEHCAAVHKNGRPEISPPALIGAGA